MAHVILWNCSPHRPTRTLGPHQLASWLRRSGYVVKVIDFCNLMSPEQLMRITEAHIEPQTLAIGVSTTFWASETLPPRIDYVHQIPSWVTQARSLLEEKHPHVQWCLGGAQVYLYQDAGWKRFSGESEDDFLSWLDHFSESRSIARSAFDIKTSFNSYLSDDRIRPEEVLPIELGRGCMFKCKFCGYDKIGKKPGTYLKSYELIRSEILSSFDRFGTTRYYLIDNTVNESPEKVRLLADLAKSLPFELEWIGYVRADLISRWPETAGWLLESGLRSAFFGIESFEKSSSHLVGKGWSGLQGKEWLVEFRQKWQRQVTWQMGFVVGLPGQTPEQLERDCQWLIEHEMYSWNHYPLWLEPGYLQSEFSANSSKYGFTFPDPARPWYWENEAWNFDLANEVCNNLQKMADGKMSLTGWSLGEYASLGFDFKSLMGRNLSEFSQPEWDQQATHFISNYVRQSLGS